MEEEKEEEKNIWNGKNKRGWSYKKKGQVKTRKEEEEKGAASDANMHGNELYLDEMGITLLFVFLS
jgi:hypothetical protein